MSSGLYYEASYSSLCKHGETICGDRVEIVKASGSIMAVLSDGLGSGIKANVLSTLTTRIATYMLKEGSGIEDVVDTIGRTLPICQVRGVACSTFSIVRLSEGGVGNIVEYDTPDIFLYREGTVTKISTKKRKVAEKEVLEGSFEVKDGDHLFMVSDGVIHAGLGDVLNLGWQWENVAEYIRKTVPKARGDSAQLSKWLTGVCDQFYGGKPGDDTTVVCIAARQPRMTSVAIGPPSRKELDAELVRKFMGRPGRKIICGGTTGNLFARELGAEMEIDLGTGGDGIPPMAKMKGVDMVTEGIITLTSALDKLGAVDAGEMTKAGMTGRDAASLLAKALLDADRLDFFVGRAKNVAHTDAASLVDYRFKSQAVDAVIRMMRALGKDVSVTYY